MLNTYWQTIKIYYSIFVEDEPQWNSPVEIHTTNMEDTCIESCPSMQECVEYIYWQTIKIYYCPFVEEEPQMVNPVEIHTTRMEL